MTPDQLEILSRQVAEELGDFARQLKATSVRLAPDCTACSEAFTETRRVGSLSLSILEESRILYFVCRECLEEILSDPDAIVSRIEERLTAELLMGGGLQA